VPVKCKFHAFINLLFLETIKLSEFELETVDKLIPTNLTTLMLFLRYPVPVLCDIIFMYAV
jgi:hypothetical protein